MQRTNVTTSLTSLKRNVIQMLGMVMLISFAALLTTHTILLQHSCTPLLEWADISTRDCPKQFSDDSGKHYSRSPEIRKTEKASKNANGNSGLKVLHSAKKPNRGNFDNENTAKEIISLAAGSIAIAGLTVIEAPVVVVAGVGFALWLAARTVLSLGK